MTTYRRVHLSVNLLMLIMLCSMTFINSVNIRNDLKTHKNWKYLSRGSDCGQSLSDRIIGGKEAPLRKYPWIARLIYTNSNGRKIYYCSGTIISSRYILTAAHCDPKHIGLSLETVRLGEHRISTYIDCQNGICAPPVQDIKVESYVCHKHYNEHFQNDICLVRTEEPIVFSSFVHSICLPSNEYFTSNNFVGSRMKVAGWGVNNITTDTTSDVLEVVALPVKHLQTCIYLYGLGAEITENQLCAGGVIGFDSCIGDSGGPLMKVFSIDGPPRYFIIGIVSYGPADCGETKTPGIYTRVDQYMTWILDSIEE